MEVGWRFAGGAPALLLCLLLCGAPAGAAGDSARDAGDVPAATIELRKSFKIRRTPGRTPPLPERGPGEGLAPDDSAPAPEPREIAAVAAALGEPLQTTGTLHLPDVGGRQVVLDGSRTPILAMSTGRSIVVDRERTIAAAAVEEISKRWPGLTVVQPPAGAGLRELTGSILDAAGYDSVLRSAPLVFGRGFSVRIVPDFLVLRDARELLTGETRAISVVAARDALPAELRELAGRHRVLTVELTPDGTPVGADRAPWRDAVGRVTTVSSSRPASIVAEVAAALGCTVEHRGRPGAAQGNAAGAADMRISRDGVEVLVVGRPDWSAPDAEIPVGGATIPLNSAVDLPLVVAALLERFKVEAVGPTVNFHRASETGGAPRFLISVPGWLANIADRRVLFTAETPPELVRLYLTREGIDLFEYRAAGTAPGP